MDPYRAALEEIVKHRNEGMASHFVWLRSALTMASGVFAIVISLHKERSATMLEYWFFIGAVGTLGLGILCGLVAARSEAAGRHDQARALLEALWRREQGVPSDVPIAEVPERWWAKVAAALAYAMFCCAVFLLIAYACVADHPALAP